MIAFILKTDGKIDIAQYLDKEDVEALKDYAGTTLQSEFMLVPDWEAFESFSWEDFAARYARKRVRVTGTLLFPMGGWQNVTPVGMDFTKGEVVDSDLDNGNGNVDNAPIPGRRCQPTSTAATPLIASVRRHARSAVWCYLLHVW